MSALPARNACRRGLARSWCGCLAETGGTFVVKTSAIKMNAKDKTKARLSLIKKPPGLGNGIVWKEARYQKSGMESWPNSVPAREHYVGSRVYVKEGRI